MKSVTYAPSRDELVVGSRRSNGGASADVGPFRLYWDNRLVIRGLHVRNARRQLEDFRRALRVVPLGGILCGVEVSDDDIRQSRQELLAQVEKDWS